MGGSTPRVVDEYYGLGNTDFAETHTDVGEPFPQMGARVRFNHHRLAEETTVTLIHELAHWWFGVTDEAEAESWAEAEPCGLGGGPDPS